MVGIVQPKADPWCCLHFTKYKFNVYRKKYIRSGRDSAVVGIVGKSKSLDFLKMLIFWSLVRNSVVLAVYLLFSVACFFTVHEHFCGGCVGLGRECFGYAKAPWGVCSKGLPVRVMRRRATLPHPVGCSTIAVPGLSFRVRNGTGRLTWAMAAANLLLYGQTLGSAGLWRPGNRTADADMSMFRLVARQCSLPSGAVCRRKMRSNRQGLEC